VIVLLFAVFFLSYSVVAKLKPIEHNLVQNGDVVTVTRSAKRQWALAYAIWVPGVLMVIAGVTFKVPFLPSQPSQVMLLSAVSLFMGAFLAYLPMILSPVIVINSKLKTIQLNKATLAFSDVR
jgi:cytochrome b subunit of formate dehydrogenase